MYSYIHNLSLHIYIYIYVEYIYIYIYIYILNRYTSRPPGPASRRSPSRPSSACCSSGGMCINHIQTTFNNVLATFGNVH